MKISDLSKKQLDNFYSAISNIKKIMIENNESELSTFINDHEDNSVISFRIYFEGLQKELEKDLVVSES